MLRVSTTLIFMVAAGAAQACPSFGLETDYLSDFFCRELGDISGPVTRDIGSVPPAITDDHPAPDWMELDGVSEAWRVDPAATLELIERIRAAGGRPMS